MELPNSYEEANYYSLTERRTEEGHEKLPLRSQSNSRKKRSSSYRGKAESSKRNWIPRWSRIEEGIHKETKEATRRKKMKDEVFG
ncbi:hypothetical protein MUK42_34462 [Musa troglodytarum]|uniref:Uncharacterized protein n=1 Tax=Musa troglodytarum TaxID=320322 RepID=A0A9E7L7C9_9LILI|nr:hypothetical protein MUK42_34462 [Musa troglodytarum]